MPEETFLFRSDESDKKRAAKALGQASVVQPCLVPRVVAADAVGDVHKQQHGEVDPRQPIVSRQEDDLKGHQAHDHSRRSGPELCRKVSQPLIAHPEVIGTRDVRGQRFDDRICSWLRKLAVTSQLRQLRCASLRFLMQLRRVHRSVAVVAGQAMEVSGQRLRPRRNRLHPQAPGRVSLNGVALRPLTGTDLRQGSPD